MADIEERIAADWPDEPVPLLLVRAIAKLQPAARAYLTLPLMRRILTQTGAAVGAAVEMRRVLAADIGALLGADLDRSLREIYAFAEYLASERIGLLVPGFQLVRDDDTVEPLDDEAVAEACESGKLYDPDTGEEVPKWSQHVIIYYRPSAFFSSVTDGV